MSEIQVSKLTEQQASAELALLADVLATANKQYHTDDAPKITDAEYDRLKRRNADIEAAFPNLKREDSASDRVGAPVSETFSKITHAVRMLSLGNALIMG